jgi:fatty acid synthase subunit alpha, fungi type
LLCSDKAGRSIPAPGRGALSIAREVQSKHPPPVLDIGYRARQVSFRRRQIGDWLAFEQEQLKEELEVRRSKGEVVDSDFFASRVADLETEAYHQEKDVLATYGMLMQSSEGADPRIAPLRRALAVWGLTADDIGVLSIHGTSTQANEKNETYIWNTILKTLDRSAGNAVPIIAQKSLVGHSKGGAAAWQMAGLLQSIENGVVPGNRNADNVDALFQQHSLLMFPSKAIQTDGISAGIMVRLHLHSHMGMRLTRFIVVIRFRPGWRNCSYCSSTLCPCRSATLCVRVVQSTTQRA